MSDTENTLEDAPLPPVLKASVHDLRFLASLLRGVNFMNNASVTMNHSGLIINVEEARTLLATAYIFSDVFDEYAYTPESGSATLQTSQNDDELGACAFEIPLNTLVECLNIFGTAGSISSSTSTTSSGKLRQWKRPGEDSDHEADDDADGQRRGTAAVGNRTIDQYFAPGSDHGTAMRMTYAGSGYPLTLLIAEDASGPTTTCEITTYDAEPRLELEFDPEYMTLKIILKSSWLRDALSEIDATCDKITIIGNPPDNAKRPGRAPDPGKPMLRIQATGNFGSTEMDYPNDREVLETFECVRPVTFSYRFGHISRALRALQISSKTSLRIDEQGLLSLQFLMPSPRRGASPDESANAFIEYRCLALDDSLV